MKPINDVPVDVAVVAIAFEVANLLDVLAAVKAKSGKRNIKDKIIKETRITDFFITIASNIF
jgi:hypothetical protein